MAKQFAVLGLGKFGSEVARQLASDGAEVLAVDREPHLVDVVKDVVARAAIADVTDRDALNALGVDTLDAVVVALGGAMEAARETPAEGVPLHIRNAPTNLMKELGYNAGYQYAHDAPEGFLPQEYLPEKLRGRTFYSPGTFGFEKEIAKRHGFHARSELPCSLQSQSKRVFVCFV